MRDDDELKAECWRRHLARVQRLKAARDSRVLRIEDDKSLRSEKLAIYRELTEQGHDKKTAVRIVRESANVAHPPQVKKE